MKSKPGSLFFHPGMFLHCFITNFATTRRISWYVMYKPQLLTATRFFCYQLFFLDSQYTWSIRSHRMGFTSFIDQSCSWNPKLLTCPGFGLAFLHSFNGFLHVLLIVVEVRSTSQLFDVGARHLTNNYVLPETAREN